MGCALQAFLRGGDMLVAEHMTREVITLPADMEVLKALMVLARHDIAGAPVVDVDGRFLGVFSEKCSMNAMTHTVEAASECGLHLAHVREFMTSDLVTLLPSMT